jgi:16S rRNA (cytosine967-C5)-methyltransferase
MRNASAIARDYAHPLWLVERWIAQYGAGRAEAICRYDQQVPVTALRLRAAAAEAELREAGIEFDPGRLMTAARRVLRGDPARSRACADGRVFIQDEASQLVAALVGSGQRILDCCAAPGGKTAALADRNPQAEIMAADLHEHRARLMRRLVRAPNVRIIAADARVLPVTGEFDRVLADVPCSGTGTLARNPEIKWRLKAEDLADLHARQVAILRAALDRLARGGRLVYSTCSLEPEENEAVVEEALARCAGFHLLDAADELRRLQTAGELAWHDISSLTQGPFLRTLPGVQPCDGFFAALVKKY